MSTSEPFFINFPSFYDFMCAYKCVYKLVHNTRLWQKGKKINFQFFLFDFPIDFYLHTHDFKISLEFNGESCEIITFTLDEERLEGWGKGEILIDMFSWATQGFLLLSLVMFTWKNKIYGRNPSRIPIYLQLEFIPQIDLTRKENRKSSKVK